MRIAAIETTNYEISWSRLGESALATRMLVLVKRKNRIAPPDDMNKDFAAAVLRFAQQTDNEAMDEFVRPFAAQ